MNHKHSYNVDAVERQIELERRRGTYISRNEQRLIHALLKGRG